MQEKIRTMKNIHVLPTDKPSRLFIYNGDLGCAKGFSYGSDAILNQHIYITDDSEIKDGDWYWLEKINKIGLESGVYKSSGAKVSKLNTLAFNCKKIILTTDRGLIKDGVQAIDDEFLEWFVKNPSCEEVKVTTYHVKGCISGKLHYKIIIQKEESVDMKQTAVEFLIEMFDLTSDHYSIKGVINQAKELEKQQMKKVWSASYENMRKTFGTSNYTPIDFEDFWNKFKNE